MDRAGARARFDRNEPVDQAIVAEIITARPSAVDPAPRPGATTSRRPDETRERAEASRARRALAGDQAQDDDLQRHRSGDHRRDARVDPRLGNVHQPHAEPEKEHAGDRARHRARARVTRNDVPRQARIAARRSAATRNRDPAARSGGIVSTATLIPKYVEPQTT